MTFHPQIKWNKSKNCKNIDEAKFSAFFFSFINQINLMSSTSKKTTLARPLFLKTVIQLYVFKSIKMLFKMQVVM